MGRVLFPQQRIQVPAGLPVTYMREPLEMVEAGAPDVDLLLGHVHDMRDMALAAKNAFAQANGTYLAVLAECQDDAAFRVGKIDQQRTGA